MVLAGGELASADRRLCLDCLAGGAQLQLDFDTGSTYTSAARRRSNKKAKKSEEKTAAETGGRCTGYLPDAGDSRNSRFFFEDKTPTAGERKSYRLTEGVVLKGRSQAQKAGLTPVFRIHLKNVSIGVMLWNDLISLVRETP